MELRKKSKYSATRRSTRRCLTWFGLCELVFLNQFRHGYDILFAETILTEDVNLVPQR
jgi:hypothetical protein